MTNPNYQPPQPKTPDMCRIEVGPVGGDNHSIRAMLNRWAGEGWRIVSAVVVPVMMQNPQTGRPQEVPGIMWIMERRDKPKASPELERLAMPVLETLAAQAKAAAPFLTGIMRDKLDQAVQAAEAFLGQEAAS